MIRREVIRNLFDTEHRTIIHQQATPTDLLRNLPENLGVTISQNHIFTFDPRYDHTFRSVDDRLIRINQHGRADTPEDYQIEITIQTIRDEIAHTFEIAGLNNQLYTCINHETAQENINGVFHGLLSYNNHTLVQGHTPFTVVDQYNQYDNERFTAILPSSRHDWSMTHALNNVISFYNRPEQIQLQVDQRFSSIRRFPRQLEPASFANSLTNLRSSRLATLSRLSTYTEESTLEPDEFEFIRYFHNLSEANRNFFRRNTNLQTQINTFSEQNPHIQLTGPATPCLIPFGISTPVGNKIHSQLTPAENQITNIIAEQQVDSLFTSSLSTGEINPARFIYHIRRLFQLSISSLPENYRMEHRITKPTVSFITAIKILIKMFNHPYLHELEETAFSFNPTLSTLESDFYLYFIQYMLLHLELNQYTRLLKTIIQYTEHENPNDLFFDTDIL